MTYILPSLRLREVGRPNVNVLRLNGRLDLEHSFIKLLCSIVMSSWALGNSSTATGADRNAFDRALASSWSCVTLLFAPKVIFSPQPLYIVVFIFNSFE